MDSKTKAGALIREARRRGQLTQVELARRAHLTQSVVSAYESSSRQPSLPTLIRLIGASGLGLELKIVGDPEAESDSGNGLGAHVQAHRDDILRLAAKHGASDVRLFGSVARGTDTSDSDLDILVDLEPQVGLITLGRLEHDLQSLLGIPVDVVPADSLKPSVRARVLADARPL